ncbi:MAG TPA: tetratricopeptide repeat protein [Acidobacteriaceae bacterium]
MLSIAVLLAGAFLPARSVKAAEHKNGGETTAGSLAHYLLPFGANPYAPGEARGTFSGFLDPGKVPSAAYCGQCHKAIYREWRESAHANAFRTPWYQKNVNQMIAEKGIPFTRHCESCHNPIALFSGVLTPANTTPRPFDDEGVTCMTCHAIERAQAVRGLGSYVLGTPSALLDEHGNPIPGEPAQADILAHLDRHKQAVTHVALRNPEMCGSCHKANLPQSLNDYKWLRAFTTYDEWQQSGWSGQTPISFFSKPANTCQSCHMPSATGVEPAAKDGVYHSHRWAAANTLIPAQYGYPDQEKAVEAFLRSGALRVDVFALSQEAPATPGKHPQLGAFTHLARGSVVTLHPGKPVTVSIVIQNTGIGHSFVPEQRDFYESWLAVDVRDQKGRMVYISGETGPDHRLSPNTHTFNNQIISSRGERLEHHEVWRATARAYDSTVSPGRADVERYRFTVPQGTESLTIHAAVKYRRFRREFTDWVFNDGPSAPDRGPTIVVAEDTVILHAGENTPVVSLNANKPPEEIRFAAFGIGMLDRQDFKAAEEAFHKIVDLQPRSAVGYIDMGVALYSEGNFASALDWLDKAARIEPENIRARYYQGLCYRWQYRYPQAAAAFQTVARAYPRFRQVHDDLGWVYLIQRHYDAARAEFEAALAVDPDDIFAHKWLSAVYTAQGDRTRAAAEAAQEAQMKDDPAAQWRVLNYWRGHHDVAAEVTPGHVHGDSGTTATEVERILNTQNPPSMVWIQH